MSKLNINFNGTSFSIDESALSAASADLKEHLSSVMNGEGATINLGGVAYNIDSTKLSSAKNDFVSHLGTIAGSGSKIVVGGVEYSVDSAKISEAIDGLSATLGDLGSTDEEPETPTEAVDWHASYVAFVFADGEGKNETCIQEASINKDGSIVAGDETYSSINARLVYFEGCLAAVDGFEISGMNVNIYSADGELLEVFEAGADVASDQDLGSDLGYSEGTLSYWLYDYDLIDLSAYAGQTVTVVYEVALVDSERTVEVIKLNVTVPGG